MKLTIARRPAATLLGLVMTASLWGSQMNDVAPGENEAGLIRQQAIALPNVESAGAIFVAVSFEDAERRNLQRPFSDLPNPPATPFRSNLAGNELERAVTCLAVAALYEAGASRHSQMPVMQVVLNRVRHPAYPSSICEVVFQGSERSTGCQFTFTCDGAMSRWRPSVESMSNARALAASMIEGRLVDERVGWATHYHTDWVLPYWSPNLVKLTAVQTHIFYRWPGTWGQRSAFRQLPGIYEAPIEALAMLDPAHLKSEPQLAASELELADRSPVIIPEAISIDQTSGSDARMQITERTPEIFPLAVAASPGRWSIDAVRHCDGKPQCQLVGWARRAPCTGAVSRDCLTSNPPDFVYIQVLRDRVQTAYWDCDKWPQGAGGHCLGNSAHRADLAFPRW